MLADHLHLKNACWLFWSTSWGLESEFEAVVREYLTKHVWAQTCMLPGVVQCILSLFSLSSLWVLSRSGEGGREGGGGGRDWLANPTSPMDREQMGPDTLHTNHCQGSFSCSCDRFKMTTNVYSNTRRAWRCYNHAVEKYSTCAIEITRTFLQIRCFGKVSAVCNEQTT